jgi:hypothetical protein
MGGSSSVGDVGRDGCLLVLLPSMKFVEGSLLASLSDCCVVYGGSIYTCCMVDAKLFVGVHAGVLKAQDDCSYCISWCLVLARRKLSKRTTEDKIWLLLR